MLSWIKGNKTFLYEIGMVLLAFCSVATIWYKSSYNDYVIWGTWMIFLIDFVYKLIISSNKLQYIKSNPFLLIALIPLDAVFQLARTARLLHLMRLKVITKYYTAPLINKLKKQRFSFVVPVSLFFVFFSIIPLYYTEPHISSYWDAFVGGVASLVFFGYSEVEPVSLLGKGSIIFLTVFGVILHGVLISALLSIIFEMNVTKKIKEKLKQRKVG